MARNKLLHNQNDTDPMGTVANLFDVAMVFAVALMVALVSRFNMTEIFSKEDYTMVKNPGQENMEIITKEGKEIKRYTPSEQKESSGKRGKKVGVAYELENGKIDLNGTDIAVVKGEIGVAENAAVWIPQTVKYKALYFIAEKLVIVLDKNRIVSNMHQAYERVKDEKYKFGTFISGPSKTADIEQALVMGAHGARDVLVILK